LRTSIDCSFKIKEGTEDEVEEGEDEGEDISVML